MTRESSPTLTPTPPARERAWYHTIDLPDGSVTRGMFDTRAVAELVQWPAGLAGGRCLDVGTCDGFWAFEMERRGAAEVIAIDVDEPDPRDASWGSRWRPLEVPSGGDERRFDIARRALGSRVRRLSCSVHDLDPTIHGRFDVVFCGSLLVHLRDPVHALERMRAVCAGELVLVECVDARLDVLAPRAPCARFASVPAQWWRPNRAGLLALVRAAGFEVTWASRRFHTAFGPAVTGQAARRRPRRAVYAVLARLLRAFPAAPVITTVLGLALGTYDVAVRARPRLATPPPGAAVAPP
ncbi:MAG TPA: class I SAM-dependent methyltransferase [Candidatus Acidoferrum sp.]|nr:class I SAM-dependent methyltransferase [Candidatus Acidoferrum sp.]